MNDNKYDSNISPHSVQFHLNCAVNNAVSEENTVKQPFYYIFLPRQKQADDE